MKRLIDKSYGVFDLRLSLEDRMEDEKRNSQGSRFRYNNLTI